MRLPDRTSILLAALALAFACGRDLALPPAPAPDQPPGTVVTPIVLYAAPDVAVVTLGSPIVLVGSGLQQVDEVRISTIRVEREELRWSRPGENEQLEFNVRETDEWLAAVAPIDGRPVPVRLLAGGQEFQGPWVRIFSGRSQIDQVAPQSLAPGQLLYLRGTGFDAEIIDHNEVFLAEESQASECASIDGRSPDAQPGSSEAPPDSPDGGGELGPPAGGESSPEEPPLLPGLPCARATVFWATDELVLAVVPDNAPSGAVKVRFWNRAFDTLDVYLQEAADAGKAAEEVLMDATQAELAPPDGGGGPGSGDSGGAVAPSAPTYSGDSGDTLTVWRDPGRLQVDRSSVADGGTVTLTSEERLFYPSREDAALLDHRLQVLVDGDLPPSVEMGDSTSSLVVRLPYGLAPGPHGIQVVNPFFESPMAWVRVE